MSACGYCGHDPACGHAEIDGTPYCHGDCSHEECDRMSCYMRASRRRGADLIAMLADPDETR